MTAALWVQIPEGSSWQELGIWKLSLIEYLKPQEFAKVENVERRGKELPTPVLLGTPTTQSTFVGQPGDEDTTKTSEEAAQEEEPGGVCKVFPEGRHDQLVQMLLFSCTEELLFGVMGGSHTGAG